MAFLWEMLYESIHVPDGSEPPSRSILREPDIAHYLEHFGAQAGDDAQVAVGEDGERIGAAFCRQHDADDPGYGFVSVEIPEVGMAVVAAHRGRGIGRRLLTDMLERHPTISLSVDADNVRATRLYVELGFAAVSTVGTSMTMICERSMPSNGDGTVGTAEAVRVHDEERSDDDDHHDALPPATLE